jgi:hypothetical protein
MPSWSFRTHISKDGKRIIYARSRQPFRQENDEIGYRQVERSCGTGSLQIAREKTREFDLEYAEELQRSRVQKGEELTFADACEQYLLTGGSGRYLAPIIEKIGLKPVREIDQAVVLSLAKELQPGCKPSTLNRHIWTPVCAVMRFVGVRADLKRGHDKLPTIDKTELPHDGWFDAVLEHLSPPKAALLLLITCHGLRISEAIERTPDDLDPMRWTLSVPDSKTGLPFLIRLAEPVVEAIKEMQRQQQDDDARRQARRLKPRPRRWLFGTCHRSNVARDFARACEAAGVASFGTHIIGRHSFAARVLEEGKSLVFLQTAGRWKSLKAVARYAHLAQDEVADEVREMGKRWVNRPRKGKVVAIKHKSTEAD